MGGEKDGRGKRGEGKKRGGEKEGKGKRWEGEKMERKIKRGINGGEV